MIRVTSNGRQSCIIETVGSNKVIAVEVAAMLLYFQKDNPEIMDILENILDNHIREAKQNKQ